MYIKRLLVIGAGFLQTFVIRRAKELGYYVLAVDGNADAEGFRYADEFYQINIIDQQACLEYAKAHRVDGVMTAATDFGVLTAAYIAQEMGLPGMGYDAAQLVKNKYRVRKCFYENRVDDTEQAYEVDASTDLESLSSRLCYPVMVKPCDGSGSRGAGKASTPAELVTACKLAMSNSIIGRAEIETFIDGSEFGVESLVVDGQVHVMAVMRKWMTQPPYYAELGHAVPAGLSEKLEKKIRRCATDGIKALGIQLGAVNMDLLVTGDEKVHIVDVGARMGGNLIGSHLVPLGAGIDYIACLIRAAVGDSVELEPTREPVCVATKLLALTPGMICGLPDMEAISREFGVEVVHHLRIGEKIREYHTNLDGCGYVVAVAESVQEAVCRAESARAAIDTRIRRG